MHSFALLILLLWLGSLATADAQTATLTGIVVDSLARQPVPGVDVVVKLEGALRGHASTDEKGFYSVSSLPLGTYTVEFINISYKKHIVEPIVINIDTAYQVNGRLSYLPEGDQTLWLRKPILDPWEFDPSKRVIDRDPNSAIRIR